MLGTDVGSAHCMLAIAMIIESSFPEDSTNGQKVGLL